MFVMGHFQEIGIAAVLLGLKPRHVEKLRECRLTDVGESKLTGKKKKHAQNVRSRSHNGRSNNLFIRRGIRTLCNNECHR